MKKKVESVGIGKCVGENGNPAVEINGKNLTWTRKNVNKAVRSIFTDFLGVNIVKGEK